ncbi:MAG: hypothetical protein Q9207_004736 [Kuettlingeria erythrocarpa]
MDDDNVVAYIYPAVGTLGYAGAVSSIEESAASPRYRPPRRLRPQVLEARHRGPPDIFRKHERAPTVEEDEEDEKEVHDDLEYEACIKVTFDCIPKTRSGLRAGRSDDAELRLIELPGVGFYHFTLTFDNNYCLVVRDLGSTCGTTVVYDGTGRGRWSNFNWIVGGSDFLKRVSLIVVKVTQFVQFQLVIPRHDSGSKSYQDKVDRFCAGTADVEQLLDLDRVGLLSRVRTIDPSGVQTPASQPAEAVTLRKKIGRGGFGVVYRVWNVSTGEQFALKKPKKLLYNGADWEKEIVIMERIDHEHIVSLLDSCSVPSPWLHLEYMPEGSISDHLRAGRPFSHYECEQIFAQSSDALAYLHTLDPQIVHRDVKPDNLLILHRRPGDLFIKFADFGSSREGDTLKSICGTFVYLAPEIYEGNNIPRKHRAAYTALVDIWSLGVVLAELLCGLPKGEKDQSMGVEWCQSVRQRVEMMLRPGEDDLLSFVLESMLCLRPDVRKKATDCHQKALLLLDRARESNRGVSGGHCSDSLETEDSTIRLGKAGSRRSNSVETGSGELSVGSSSLSSYIIRAPGRRHDRSCNAPSPKTVPKRVEQLLSEFRDPENSLFYRSSFGEDSDDSSSDGGKSGSASTVVRAQEVKPQDGRAEGSSVSGFAAPPEADDLEHGVWETRIRGVLLDALEAVSEVPETCTGNGAGAALSVKRSRAAR